MNEQNAQPCETTVLCFTEHDELQLKLGFKNMMLEQKINITKETLWKKKTNNQAMRQYK
jgi:hypothetical protein